MMYKASKRMENKTSTLVVVVWKKMTRQCQRSEVRLVADHRTRSSNSSNYTKQNSSNSFSVHIYKNTFPFISVLLFVTGYRKCEL